MQRTERITSRPMPDIHDLQQRAPRTVGALLTVTPCRKVYVAGWLRIHHGLVGEAAVLAAVLPLSLAARAALVALGAALMWDDRRDWPFPIRDRIESSNTS
jgi:hypothetical protein